MFKLKLYKFLGTFIPYFKRKIMTINYYINNWDFIRSENYTHNAVPRIGEKVELFIDEKITQYIVKDVIYSGNDIKILL